MTHVDSSRKVIETLRTVAASAKSMEPEEVLKAYDDAESTLFSLVSESDSLALELRRRIAEGKLMALSSRDMSFDRLLALHANLKALGFSDLQKEFTMGVLFAEVCRRLNEPTHLKSLIHALRSRLDEAEPKYDAEIMGELRTTLMRIEQG